MLKKIIFSGGEKNFYRLNIPVKPICERNIGENLEHKHSSLIMEDAEVEIYEIFAIPNPKKKHSVKNAVSVFKKNKKQIKRGIILGGQQKETLRAPIKCFKKVCTTQIASNVLKNGLNFAVFSSMIFMIGFFGMNASAYLQMGKYYVQQNFQSSMLKNDAGMSMTELAVQKSKNITIAPLLATYKDPEKEKKNIPLVSANPMPPDNRIYIPKIGKNVPIVKTDAVHRENANWDELEKEILNDLKKGVVHYPGTADPGEKGNVFITGHSSYYPWDDGAYKDVFALLGKLELGDEIHVFYDQEEYHYRVNDIQEVKSDNTEILEQTDDFRLTLMTCTPLGTNLRRLVITAMQG